MPSEYVRPIGKPVVEKATNGLRKVTRKYVVHGPSSSGGALDAGLVEERVFLDFCTPDEEYTDAVLVSQKLEGSTDPSQDVLTRIYLEVSAEPVEVDLPDYQRDGMGRLRVTRKFVVATEYADAYAESRIGNPDENFETSNGDICILAKVVMDEHPCFSEYQEQFFQTGIVSYKEDVKYNGKLKIRTYRTIGVETQEEFLLLAEAAGLPTPTEWVLVTEMSGSGSTDYQFGGLEVSAWVLVRGQGRVMLQQEDAGAAQITTEMIIVADEEDYASFSEIPVDQVYETRVDDKDGYDLWTIKGVVGQGEIDRKHEVRHNGALEIITIKAVGQQASPPAGFVRVSEDHDQSGRFDIFTDIFVKGLGVISVEEEDIGTAQITTEVWATENGGTPPHSIPVDQVYETRVEEKAGYEIHTVKGVVGSGEVDRREETKHNGALSVITIKNVGQQSAAPVGYVRISEEHDQSGRFDIFTDIYVKGAGLLSLSEDDKGTAQITTEVWITADGGAPPSNIPVNQVYETNVEERDGYEIHTIRGVVGSGEIERREEHRKNGALEVITIRAIGAQSAVPAGFVRVSESLDQSGRFDIFSDVYAKGTGLITSTTEEKGLATLTTEVWLTPNGGAPATNIPAGQIYKQSVDEQDGYEIHTLTGVVGAGEISRREETKNEGKLSIITIQNIGQQSAVPAGYVRISESEDNSGQFAVFTDVYALGEGRISTRVAVQRDHTLETTIVYLEADDEAVPAGCVILEDESKKDGYTIYTKTYSSSLKQGELERSVSQSGGVTNTKIISLDAVPNADGCVIARKEQEFEDVDGGVCRTLYDYTFASGEGEMSRSVTTSGGVTQTRIKSIGIEPADAGCLVSKSSETSKDVDGADCLVIYDYTFADGSGEIARTVDSGGGVTKTTIRNIGAEPVHAGCVIARRTEEIKGIDGVCHTIYELTFAEGSGELSRHVSNNRGLTHTRVKTIGVAPAEPGCLVRQNQEDSLDVNGGACLTVYDYEYVDGQGVESTSVKRVGGVSYQRIVTVGQQPAGVGCITAASEEPVSAIGACALVRYDWTFATGAGEIDRSVRSEGGKTYTTIKHFGAVPLGFGCVMGESSEALYDIDGNACDYLYSRTYLTFPGGVFHESTRTDGNMSIVTVKAINFVPQAPQGFTCAWKRSETAILDKDGVLCGTEYEYSFAQGPPGGLLDSSVTLKSDMSVTTIVTIGQPAGGLIPPGACITQQGTADVLDVDGAVCYEKVTTSFVQAAGLLDQEVTDGPGGITLTRIRTVGAAPANPNPGAGTCIKSRTVTQLFDINGVACFQKFDYTFLTPPALFTNIRESVRHLENGVTLRTVESTTGPGVALNADECVVEQDEETIYDLNGNPCYINYRTVFASGRGVVDSTTFQRNGVNFVTIKSVGKSPPDAPDFGLPCPVARRRVAHQDIEGNDCWYTYEYTYVLTECEKLDESSTQRADGSSVITVKTIGCRPDEVPPIAGLDPCIIAKREEKVISEGGGLCAIIYTWDFVIPPDSGEYERETSTENGLTYVTIKSIGAAPDFSGCLVRRGEVDVDDINGDTCYTKYNYKYLDTSGGEQQIGVHTEVKKCLTYTTYKTLNGPGEPHDGCMVASSEETILDVEGSDCATITSETYVTGDGELDREVTVRDGVTYTKIQTIGTPPSANGCRIEQKSERMCGTGDCPEIFTAVFATGDGVIEEQTEEICGVEYKTVRSIGATPVAAPANSIILKSQSKTHRDIDGNAADCYTEWVVRSKLDGGEPCIATRIVHDANGATLRYKTCYDRSEAESVAGDCIVQDDSRCTPDGVVYTVGKWSKPEDYTTYATAQYQEMGEIELDTSTCQILPTKAPVSTQVMATIEVTYGDNLGWKDANLPFSQYGPPTVQEIVTFHSGQILYNTRTFENYRLIGGDTTCDKGPSADILWNGTPVAHVHIILKGSPHEYDVNGYQIIKASSQLIFSCEGESPIFRNEVWRHVP